VLGAVLGFMVESNYRRSLQLSGGEHAIFVTDPVSLGLLVAAAVLVVYSFAKRND
jgi:putative tricarboxylic transport membrane protein